MGIQTMPDFKVCSFNLATTMKFGPESYCWEVEQVGRDGM
jgi:hypothetical protein